MIFPTAKEITIPILRIEIQEEIRGHLINMCGLALSNRQAVTAPISASVGVALFGDRFSDRNTQKALLSVLELTEKETGWPTSGGQAALKEAWEWDESI